MSRPTNAAHAITRVRVAATKHVPRSARRAVVAVVPMAVVAVARTIAPPVVVENVLAVVVVPVRMGAAADARVAARRGVQATVEVAVVSLVRASVTHRVLLVVVDIVRIVVAAPATVRVQTLAILSVFQVAKMDV